MYIDKIISQMIVFLALILKNHNHRIIFKASKDSRIASEWKNIRHFSAKYLRGFFLPSSYCKQAKTQQSLELIIVFWSLKSICVFIASIHFGQICYKLKTRNLFCKFNKLSVDCNLCWYSRSFFFYVHLFFWFLRGSDLIGCPTTIELFYSIFSAQSVSKANAAQRMTKLTIVQNFPCIDMAYLFLFLFFFSCWFHALWTFFKDLMYCA